MDANTTTTQEGENNPLPTRFEVELEFVQSLANIPYVTYLFTQQQIKENNNFNWKSPEFKNYLKYLEYWCQPPYSQCIVYPNALHVLKLINGFFETNATVNEDGLLDGVDELPRFLQLQGPHIMNEMVNRWEQ
ncbi:mediator of RNA polymerase II transcription subunit 31 [Monosporozyma servazzii]